MVARKFTVFLEPAEEGGFIVKCGELPVATQDETREEALRNIKEAIEGYLEVKAKLLGSKIKGEKRALAWTILPTDTVTIQNLSED